MIREKIEERINELGITQMKCAADNELSYSGFNQFLRGHRAFPLSDIERVFEYLGLEIVGEPIKKRMNKK